MQQNRQFGGIIKKGVSLASQGVERATNINSCNRICAKCTKKCTKEEINHDFTHQNGQFWGIIKKGVSLASQGIERATNINSRTKICAKCTKKL